MSWHRSEAPSCRPGGRVALVIEPRARDLGSFTVKRVLPSPERRMVGPFIFIDEMGPAQFAPGEGMNVRPHPHIGLATVTYLFEGEILHRDSLGYVQPIQPGAVNLMTAGRGIVHSERTATQVLSEPRRLHGMQTWMALPTGAEEIEPAFEHYPRDTLPTLAGNGLTGRLIIGRAYGLESPVRAHSETLYVHVDLAADSELALPQPVKELAVYLISGRIELGDCRLTSGQMAVLADDARPPMLAREPSRAILVGGEPLGERHIWWNFVASSPARIEQAKRDWRDGSFARVPGDDEFIPLPDR